MNSKMTGEGEGYDCKTDRKNVKLSNGSRFYGVPVNLLAIT